MSTEQPFDPSLYLRTVRTRGADRGDVLRLLREHQVRFLQLHFTDTLGGTRSVEVPARQFEAALEGDIICDGSAIHCSTREDETDMRLQPDLDTFRILPWGEPHQRTGRLICDVLRVDGSTYEGDPRGVLRRTIERLADAGLETRAGAEVEFFVFQNTLLDGAPATPADRDGYFGLTPGSAGHEARQEMVAMLERLGLAIDGAHHGVAPGQHQIALGLVPVLTLADDLVALRSVVRAVASWRGLRATFMPKPNFGRYGSGLHAHYQLLRGGENAFHDPEARDGLSDELRYFVGGLLRHAHGYCAVTNPLVNSYKRLVPGYEAPVNVAWSLHNGAQLVRIPAPRGPQLRCEHRMPDAAANPYLVLAVQLSAGLAGMQDEADPGEPVNKNIAALSERERRRLHVHPLPINLGEALSALARDRVVRSTLGEHIYSDFVESKQAEWAAYSAQVHRWEVERYLDA